MLITAKIHEIFLSFEPTVLPMAKTVQPIAIMIKPAAVAAGVYLSAHIAAAHINPIKFSAVEINAKILKFTLGLFPSAVGSMPFNI